MQDQDVYIIGAGNSAGQAALHIAKYARSVTLVVRSMWHRDALRRWTFVQDLSTQFACTRYFGDQELGYPQAGVGRPLLLQPIRRPLILDC
jgi:hypothetical protein